MLLPLPLVLKAADALREQAMSNHHLAPATRLEMLLRAEVMPARWLGSVLLQRALSDDQK